MNVITIVALTLIYIAGFAFTATYVNKKYNENFIDIVAGLFCPIVLPVLIAILIGSSLAKKIV